MSKREVKDMAELIREKDLQIVLLAAECAYRLAEKGHNLEYTLAEVRRVYLGKAALKDADA